MVISDKGGTGKSIFSRALADRLRRDRIDSLLVDGDGTVGQLLQFYGERDEAGRLQEQTPDRGVPLLCRGSMNLRVSSYMNIF